MQKKRFRCHSTGSHRAAEGYAELYRAIQKKFLRGWLSHYGLSGILSTLIVAFLLFEVLFTGMNE